MQDAVLITHQHNIRIVFNDQTQVLVFSHILKFDFQCMGNVFQSERNGNKPFLAVIQPEEIQQRVEQGKHPLGGQTDMFRISVYLRFSVIFLYQFGIPVNCGKWCTQFMGNSVHGFLA